MTHNFEEGVGQPSLSYAEHEGGERALVLVHAQGIDRRSFDKVIKPLSKDFTVYAVDCFGHGRSAHNPNLYNIVSLGDALARFVEEVVGRSCMLLGHSSGGLVAAYAAGKTELCEQLVLEDPPFFACQGERRRKTFNYLDLSSVCHEYLQGAAQGSTCESFVLFYFENQYAWSFFPEKAREKVRPKSIAAARKFLQKHPGQDLKVPFWPKTALAAFVGMGDYDPRFGEAFYDDSFHCGIPHEELLGEIKCPTLFMKAKTEWSDDGVLFAALDEDDLAKCMGLISDCALVRFDCGHGIHIEKPRAFVSAIKDVSVHGKGGAAPRSAG
ncbi:MULTISPECIES: alpha/beta fold hydrolase [unclassified Adlercreutzia]|uniref:alpha/beta fold hydrolase n=1 Tax=unclassified Adlercreutzia TaxID=2636013 RepID=UPI0013EBE3AE|nr:MULTISPECIES: alpha/beta hydrolase [unclassified Adlercreutzia]